MNVPQSQDRLGKWSQARPARVVIADDQPAILKVISQTLSPDYTIVGSYGSGPDLLRDVASLHPDLIILDVSMEGMSGFDVARALRRMHMPARIVFLSIHEDSALVSAAIDEGAEGYVFKSRMDTDLREAVATILAGGSFVSHGAVQIF